MPKYLVAAHLNHSFTAAWPATNIYPFVCTTLAHLKSILTAGSAVNRPVIVAKPVFHPMLLLHWFV